MSLRPLLLAGAVALALAAAPAGAATLVYCSEGSPESFAPMLVTTGTTFDATHPIYSRLTEFTPGQTTIQPGLAKSWDISDDGKTVTLHLRESVKWQSNAKFKPSRDFDADDVLFTFGRQSDPNSPYFKVSGGTYVYYGDMGLKTLITKLEKVDPNTVRFTLAKPNAPFLSDLWSATSMR